jgi:ribonuclease VapC
MSRTHLERLLDVGGFEVVAVTPIQAMRAIEAFRCFGRGRHPAGLNIGDCFVYALATTMEEELLFKGEDLPGRTFARRRSISKRSSEQGRKALAR